ncbi:MAG: TolC family protein [Bryobacteraceae bacterium]
MFRLQLEGRLATAWVTELQQCWKTASSAVESKALVVNLDDVCFVDASGMALLAEMHRAGATFTAATPYQREIVEEITGQPTPEGDPSAVPTPWIRKLVSALFLLAAFLTVPQSPLLAQTGDVLHLTMKEAVVMALKQNPQVQIANLNVALSQQDEAIAKSALLPQLRGQVSQTVRKDNLEANFGGRKFPGLPSTVGPFPVIQLGPTGSASIFDLTLYKRLQSARQDTVTGRAQELTTREQTVLLTVSQYLAAMRNAATVKASQSRVELSQAIFDQATDLQKAGVGTGIDTLRANVQLQSEKQRLIVSETQLRTSLLGLARLLNIGENQHIELADDLRSQKVAAPESREVAAAYENRPEMKTALSRERSAELEREEARSEWLPKLSFSGGYLPTGVHVTDILETYQAQVSLTIPIYTGGRRRAYQRKAEIDIKRAEQDRKEVRNQITEQARTAQAELESSSREVEVASLGVKLAAEEVAQSRDRFQAGVANNIEVVTAQDRLARASDDEIAALYRYSQAQADLAHAFGEMESKYAR